MNQQYIINHKSYHNYFYPCITYSVIKMDKRERYRTLDMRKSSINYYNTEWAVE